MASLRYHAFTQRPAGAAPKSVTDVPEQMLPWETVYQEREDVRGERGEIACVMRFLLVPEARRCNRSGKGFFYRLPSPVSPPSGNHKGCPYECNDGVPRAGCPRSGERKTGEDRRKRTAPPWSRALFRDPFLYIR